MPLFRRASQCKSSDFEASVGQSGARRFFASPLSLARTTVAGFAVRLRQSAFARNALYLTGITGIERVAALIQTVLLARTLGITEYGIYGLLFGTVGLVSSVMGLQMGLTATVFVARYREGDKARAGAVIRYVMRFALIVSAVFLLAALPFAALLAHWLFQSNGYRFVLSLGCLFVVASLLSGVQDGIAEGFEDFRAIALSRLLGAALTLAAIYPATARYGLDGALVVMLVGVVVKYVVLGVVVAAHRRRNAIPRRGGGVSFYGLIKDFSLPSMLVSLLYGAVMWCGTYLLSRQSAGFAAVAVVSVGLQWQGPITLVTNALGRVAVPVFSRHKSTGEIARSREFRRKLLRFNGVAVFGVVAVLIACQRLILSLYGKDFRDGVLVFSLLLLATIPKVLADVHMQELVGHGKVWRQLWLYAPMLASAAIGFVWLVPQWGGLGYAATMLFAAAMFLLCVTFKGSTPIEQRET